MRPAIREMNGMLVTKALPVCRAARDVSMTPIVRSLPPLIDPDGVGLPASAEPSQVRVSK